MIRRNGRIDSGMYLGDGRGDLRSGEWSGKRLLKEKGKGLVK